MSQAVVIFGTGSFAEVVHFYLTHDSPFEVVGFTASRDAIEAETWHDLPVVPYEEVETRYPPEAHQMFVAVGYADRNKVREQFYHDARAKGYTLISYLCSKTTHWDDTKIGDNCFIFEDVTIQPYVTIGNNVVMWSGNHIGHHSRIGDHCFITSHVVVSGHVTIGQRCFLGVNATLRDSLTVADDCVIGAGALVMKDTQPGDVYAGPATPPRPRDGKRVF